MAASKAKPKRRPTQKNTPARKAAQKKYNAKPEQIKKRAARNTARAKMVKAGRVSKGDGKDVNHKNGNPNNNSFSNLEVTSKRTNRTLKRTSGNRKRQANGK
jgi:hypothetical protein